MEARAAGQRAALVPGQQVPGRAVVGLRATPTEAAMIARLAVLALNRHRILTPRELAACWSRAVWG